MDSNLKSGIGKICTECKRKHKGTGKTEIKTQISNPVKAFDSTSNAGGLQCPKCGSSMVLKDGIYGKFYSCSRFPRCKGTRSYLKM
ncbi:MAG TPA: topoisomerase DNA-binding C4 zinc finger domain-containing protein [bacterium]|nr:topoisomerase DNA-binding C4 zinc finger domain-containing protein [bacterium]